jgi:hypothetical protein
MPTPYVYPPYLMPTSELYGSPAIGRVDAAAGPGRIAPFDGEPPHDEAATSRYWAGVMAAASARPRPVAGLETPAAGSSTATVIPQRDTLSLHVVARQDNPFESLIAHTLHHHLTNDGP